MKLQGKLAYAPDLRFTPSGKAVSDFTLELPDGKFQRCEIWEDAAEDLADLGLDMGDTVAVAGYYKIRTWKTRDGEPRRTRYLVVRDYRYRREARAA